jgi:hypothetical protein
MGQSTSKRLPPFEVDPRLLLPPHGGMAWREFVQQRMMAVMAERAGASAAGGMQTSHTLPQHAVHTPGPQSILPSGSLLARSKVVVAYFRMCEREPLLFPPCRARGEERLVTHPCRFQFAKKLNQPRSRPHEWSVHSPWMGTNDRGDACAHNTISIITTLFAKIRPLLVQMLEPRSSMRWHRVLGVMNCVLDFQINMNRSNVFMGALLTRPTHTYRRRGHCTRR